LKSSDLADLYTIFIAIFILTIGHSFQALAVVSFSQKSFLPCTSNTLQTAVIAYCTGYWIFKVTPLFPTSLVTKIFVCGFILVAQRLVLLLNAALKVIELCYV